MKKLKASLLHAQTGEAIRHLIYQYILTLHLFVITLKSIKAVVSLQPRTATLNQVATEGNSTNARDPDKT